MDENEEMVKLLLSKAKMLSYHCPRCKLPLFKKGSTVICVRCGEVRVEREGDVNDEQAEPKSSLLERKKRDLLKRLETEKDPREIGHILEAISRIEKAQEQ